MRLRMLGKLDAWPQLSVFGMMNGPSCSCGGSCPSGAPLGQKGGGRPTFYARGGWGAVEFAWP